MRNVSVVAWGRGFLRLSIFCLLAALFAMAPLAAQGNAPSKHELTGIFWQRDPDASFEGDGANFCAPTSVADGLVYLYRGRNMKGLLGGTDKEAQIALIKALAEHMETDPDIGTNPSKIINGLEGYLQTKGYAFAKVELAGWRRIDAEHKPYLVAVKPDLAWLRRAIDDPDAIVVLNNGWYKTTDDGCRRKGGHFVIAVGTGPGAGEVQVHNPFMQPDDQMKNTAVNLSPLTGGIIADAKSNGVEELALDGYLKMEGPGLPYTSQKASFAALDFVLVFKLKKGE